MREDRCKPGKWVSGVSNSVGHLTEREANDPVSGVFGVLLLFELRAHRFSGACLALEFVDIYI